MSIPHFGALSKKRAKLFFDNPTDFSYQEKLDGSYFKVKLDDAFPWAQRKGPKVYHTPEDWGDEVWSTMFKAVHTLFFKNLDLLADIYGNLTLEMEYLQGDRPNTIEYHAKQHQLVIFSEVPEHFGFAASEHITRFTSKDGLTLEEEKVLIDWYCEALDTKYFSASNEKSIETLASSNLDPLSQEKALVKAIVPRVSQYGPNPPEGIVVTHKDGWSFKLVDREYFTLQNKSNYSFRGKLFKSAQGRANSLMDQFYANAASGSLTAAANDALSRLAAIRDEYMEYTQPYEALFIDVRNKEAMATLKKDLEDYRDGRKSV